jgi:hypothetical protein
LKTPFPAIPVRSVLAGAFLLGVLLAPGCKKPEDSLGLSVLDPADTLGTLRIDSTSLRAWPRLDDSIRTSGLSANEIGSYVDDHFGLVATGTATQLRLSLNNVGPADPTLVCDSLVLSLAFATVNPVYGDLDPQRISVFRLTGDLTTDSIYYSNRQPITDGIDLVEGAPAMFTPSPTAGPVIGGDTLDPQVRIRLNTALGNELLAQWGQSTLVDNTSFLAWFKGLYVVPDNPGQAPLQGGVWRLNLLSGASKMTLYYHNGTGVNSTFDFVIGTSSARYTAVRFDRGLASVPGLQEALVDTSLGQNATYIQSLGGMRTEVRFPWLDTYAGASLRALAKAELVVPVAGDFHSTYLPPDQLFAFRKAADGSDLLVPDQIAGQGQVGGSYDATNKVYRLNLTRWVQGVLNGTYANTGLSLVAGSNGISVNRAVLPGPAAASTPMQLVLTFTTY